MACVMTPNIEVARLFEPQTFQGVELANRIVLPPMGFHSARDGIPGANVAEYYRQRAEGGVGLIITEGTFIDHHAAGDNLLLLNFRKDSLQGWETVVREVHGEGGKIIPELWHVGLIFNSNDLMAGRKLSMYGRQHLLGPSGYIFPGQKVKDEMTQDEIDDVIDAFARGAQDAARIGFDGVEIHGAHGYIVDQFFWKELNERTDKYGGSIRNRSRFAAEIISKIRRRMGPDFLILLRISQWKLHNYSAKLVQGPEEMKEWLAPLVEAGVDIFDCSQRRYWEPEFNGSELNFAGWVKRITKKPVITVGSVGLDQDFQTSFGSATDAKTVSLENLMERLHRDEFDLVAVGRALIADAQWPTKIRTGRYDELVPFQMNIMKESEAHADLIGD